MQSAQPHQTLTPPRKLSIITVCLNPMPYLRTCVESVLDEYKQLGSHHLEHVIIDGGSTDGTLEYLQQFSHLTVHSGPDAGISDAMNKGLRLSTGDLILFLNSDDELAPGAAQWALNTFSNCPSIHWLQGSVRFIDPQGTEVASMRAHPRLIRGLRRSTKFNQQAAIMRRTLFQRFGGMDLSFRYVMDYDFWLRVYRHYPPSCVDRVVANYRIHQSNRSRTSLWHTHFEAHKVRQKNRHNIKHLTWLESYFYVFATYVRSPSVHYYFSLGEAERGNFLSAAKMGCLNLWHKPIQSPEYPLRNLQAIFRSISSSRPVDRDRSLGGLRRRSGWLR